MASRTHATGVAAGRHLEGLRLLVVEDDDLGRKALTSVLEPWGCTVIATDGVQAACQQLQPDQLPDVIVSDYRLRDGSNGIEAIRVLREKAGQPIAACLISGDADANCGNSRRTRAWWCCKSRSDPAKLRQAAAPLASENSWLRPGRLGRLARTVITHAKYQSPSP